MNIKWMIGGSLLPCLLLGCANQAVPSRVALNRYTINGQPVRMILDTGASSTFIYGAAARRIGLNFTPARSDVAASDFEVLTGLSQPVRVKAGAQAFITRLPVFTPPPAFLPADDGAIGWPEIRNNILIFDSAHRTVRGLNQLPKETTGWLKLKVRPHATLLLEAPLAQGGIGVILVDTGSPKGVQLAPRLWREFLSAHPNSPTTPVPHFAWSLGHFTAQSLWGDYLNIGPLQLADVMVENMPESESAWLAKVSDGAEFMAVLGLQALSRMDLIVDEKNEAAYLRPKPMGSGSEGNGNWSLAENVRLTHESRDCPNLAAASAHSIH